MNRLYRMLFVFLLLATFTPPAWAFGNDSGENKKLTHKNKNFGHTCALSRRHDWKVQIQYRKLLRIYNSATENAQKMFLEYVGSGSNDTNAEIQKIREEYEQQIAQLNTTINALEQKLSDMEAALKAQSDACALDTAQAYDDGFAAGKETCSTASSGNGPVLTGSWNTGNYQPKAIDVDSSGDVFILDYDDKTVVQFDSSGNQTNAWQPGMVYSPIDLALDSDGNILILDQRSSMHLQKYTSDGVQMDWNLTSGALTVPTGLFIDNQNTIYVTDAGGDISDRVQVFNSSGAYLRKIGDIPQTADETYYDVAVNPLNQNIYVLLGSGVAVFDPDGNYIKTWQGAFTQPSGLAIGTQGEVFVAGVINHEIYQYDGDGNLIYTFAANDLQAPGRLAVDDAGVLYVGDCTNLQIRLYK